MPTTGKNRGDIITITIDGTAVSHSTSHSWDWTGDTLETTDKDGGNDKTFIPGLGSWTNSGEAFVAEDATHGLDELMLLRNQIVDVVRTSGVTGDTQYSGQAILTQISETSSNTELITFSYSLQGTGAWTPATIS